MEDRLHFDVAGPRKIWQLAFGIAGAPLAFGAQLQIGYALVPWACDRGTGSLLHLVSLAAAAVAIAAFLTARRAGRDLAEPEDSRFRQRREFLSKIGMWSSAFFLLVIVALEIPNLMLGPCAI